MTDRRLIDQLRRILSTTRIGYSMLAQLAGVGVGTAKSAVVAGALPKHRGPREALERFAARNAAARRREDLLVV